MRFKILLAGLLAAVPVVAVMGATPASQSCYRIVGAPTYGTAVCAIMGIMGYVDPSNTANDPAGQPTPVSAGSPLPVTFPPGFSPTGTFNQGTPGATAWPVTDAPTEAALGTPDATAYGGSGASTMIALLKGLFAKLAGTLTTVSPPGTYAAPTTAQLTIQAPSTYQILFPAGALPNGFHCINTSPGTSNPIYVDITGASGTTRSGGAIPVGPSAGSTPVGAGTFTWMKPIANAVTIWSATAGATLACAGG